jgi:hypothetical protein
VPEMLALAALTEPGPFGNARSGSEATLAFAMAAAWLRWRVDVLPCRATEK